MLQSRSVPVIEHKERSWNGATPATAVYPGPFSATLAPSRDLSKANLAAPDALLASGFHAGSAAAPHDVCGHAQRLLGIVRSMRRSNDECARMHQAGVELARDPLVQAALAGPQDDAAPAPAVATTGDSPVALLHRNAHIIRDLQMCQRARVTSSEPWKLLPEERHLAGELLFNLQDLARQSSPGALVPQTGLWHALGIAVKSNGAAAARPVKRKAAPEHETAAPREEIKRLSLAQLVPVQAEAAGVELAPAEGGVEPAEFRVVRCAGCRGLGPQSRGSGGGLCDACAQHLAVFRRRRPVVLG